MKFLDKFLGRKAEVGTYSRTEAGDKSRNSVKEEKLIKKASSTATFVRLREFIVNEALGNLPKDVSAVLGYDFIAPFHEALMHMRIEGIAFCAYINDELLFNENIQARENNGFKNSNDFAQRFTFSLGVEQIHYENIIVFGDLLNQKKGKFIITKSQEISILNYENALLKFYRKLNDGHAWIYRINGYANSRLSKNKHEKDIHNRTEELANRTSSSVVILDKEDEFTNTQLDLNWFPDFIHEYKAKVCADFGVIFTKFFGEGATGLQATGEGDRKSWYDQVRAFQIIRIHKGLKKYASLINKASDYEKIVYEELDVTDRQANAQIDAQRIASIISSVSTGLLDYECAKKLIHEILGVSEKEAQDDNLDLKKYIGGDYEQPKQQQF